MKYITYVRHAKSSWKNSSLEDIERPLNKRGEKDAPMMAEIVARSTSGNILLISSPALRAHTTAIQFAKAFEYPVQDIQIKDNLYFKGTGAYEDAVQSIDDDDIERVFIFGHNPMTTEVANQLGEEKDNIPTCGVILAKADIDSWKDYHFENAEVEKVIFPKMYK